MAQFSIREALRFSFSTYARHMVLLVCAAAVVAATHQAFRQVPRIVAEKLGVHREIDIDMTVRPKDDQTDQSAMVLQKVQEVTAKISTHIQTTPKHLLGIVFLTWLFLWMIYLATVLGFMKLCLTLRDKGVASLKSMSVSLRQTMRFIGAFIIYILYVICGIIGISVLMVPFAVVCKGFCGDAVTGVLSILLWIGLFAAVLAWVVGYAFFGFCIADNPAVEARQSLRMSRDLTHGQRWHVIGAFVVASFFSVTALVIIHKLVGFGSSEPMGMMMTGPKKDITQALSIIVTSPFWMLYLAFIYRSLRGK